MTIETFIANLPLWVFLLVLAWSTVWKGIALWKSARRNSIAWFVVLLIVNTLGILEILYIFVFSSCCEKKKTPAKNAKTASTARKAKRRK